VTDERARAERKSRAWKARRALLDEASAKDSDALRRTRETEAEHVARSYHNEAVTLIGIGVALLLALIGWFLIQRLGSEATLEECLAAHRANCVEGIPDGR
jgi:hypothetical protein